MRFLIYLIALGAIIYFAVVLVQVGLRRLGDQEVVRGHELRRAHAQLLRREQTLSEIKSHCSNVLLVTENDIVALQILHIIGQGENA